MSELAFRHEIPQDPSEYLSRELWKLEMTLHPNLNEHHNTERVTYTHVAEGVYRSAELSRVAALAEDLSVGYCPMLVLKDGLQDSVYTWVEEGRVLYGTREQPDVEVDNPDRLKEMADGLKWLREGIVSFPERTTYDVDSASPIWQ